MAFRASRASSFILRAQTVLVGTASRAGMGPSLAVKDAIRRGISVRHMSTPHYRPPGLDVTLPGVI
jgi:hypothetical protein